MALSNTFTYYNSLLNQIISSGFIVCCIFIFYKVCRIKPLAVLIPFAVVVLRIAAVLEPNSNLITIMYYIPYSILLITVGTKMVRDHTVLLIAQISWISAITVILCIMQILGVEWTQSIREFYSHSGRSNYQYLFVKWDDIAVFYNMQVRPSGFCSYNNVLSQLLLFYYSFSILWFIEFKNNHLGKLKWLFVITFACALTGAKVVSLGIVFVNLALIIFVIRLKNLVNYTKTLLTTILSFSLYYILFPGICVFNYNLDLFTYNAIARIQGLIEKVNLPIIEKIIDYFSQLQTGNYMGKYIHYSSVDISGVTKLIDYAYIILILVCLIAPFWIINLRKLRNLSGLDMKKVPIIMVAAVISSLLGQPLYSSSFFIFFFCAITFPISIKYLKPVGHQ